MAAPMTDDEIVSYMKTNRDAKASLLRTIANFQTNILPHLEGIPDPAPGLALQMRIALDFLELATNAGLALDRMNLAKFESSDES